MFDDGSMDCFNYWVADQDGTNQVSYEFIKDLRVVGQIKAQMKLGKSHLVIKDQALVYGGLAILEIQWG